MSSMGLGELEVCLLLLYRVMGETVVENGRSRSGRSYHRRPLCYGNILVQTQMDQGNEL